MRSRTLLLGLLLASPAWAGVDLAAHQGTRTEATVLWRSTLHLDRPADRVPLAAPLPPDAEVIGAGAERDAHGQIVALTVPHPTDLLEVEVRQPWPAETLAVPLGVGPGVQRVALRGVPLAPDPALGMAKHLRYYSHPGVTRRDRRAADQLALGRRSHLQEQPLYVVADHPLSGGLRAHPAGSKGSTGAVVMALLAGLLLLCVAVFRGLSVAARAERNRVYIARHLAPEVAPDA